MNSSRLLAKKYLISEEVLNPESKGLAQSHNNVVKKIEGLKYKLIYVPVYLSHHSSNLDSELIVCVALVNGQPQASCILPQLRLQDVVQPRARYNEILTSHLIEQNNQVQHLDSQEKVSGKHFLGSMPYLVTRLTAMSHWPPSLIGSDKR